MSFQHYPKVSAPSFVRETQRSASVREVVAKDREDSMETAPEAEWIHSSKKSAGAISRLTHSDLIKRAHLGARGRMAGRKSGLADAVTAGESIVAGGIEKSAARGPEIIGQ